MTISPTFNVADLFDYHPPGECPSHLINLRTRSVQEGETDVGQLNKGILDQLESKCCKEEHVRIQRSMLCHYCSFPYYTRIPLYKCSSATDIIV